MIRGLYIASSGMTANERLQEMISNNIANAETVGYKSDNGVLRSFPDELLYRMNDNAGGPGSGTTGPIGMLSTGALLQEMVPNFVQGALQKSDNPYAEAIIDTPPVGGQGPNKRSYFAVYDPKSQQKMFTRDGDFQVDPTNLLTTGSGEYVLPVDKKTGLSDPNLRIYVDPQSGQHTIVDQQGKSANAQGVAYDSLFQEGIVDISDSTKLNKYGDNNFLLGTGAQEAQGTGQVQKGQLEQSNVDLSGQMVSMMNVMRSYEANQKMIRTLDDSLSQALTVGKVE